MPLTDGCSGGRTSSSIMGDNADQQPEAEGWEAARGREQQHRSCIGETVLTGGTAVPGHYSHHITRGLDRIQGNPNTAGRKRQRDPTAADDPAGEVVQVVSGQVAAKLRRRDEDDSGSAT